jgi:hypothetical protein
MTKTEQQKRFEAAWHTKWPNDEPRIFEQNKNGVYTWPEVQDTFEGFALGEASALERAAAEAAKCWCWKNGLITGKKLVDAGAVVLSVKDAQALDSLLTKFRVGYLLAHGFDEHNQLRIAIEQARGKMEPEEKIRMLEAQMEFTNAHNNEMQTQIELNMCEIANMLAELAVKDAEIERLKGLHNPELVPAAAHMILTQRDEIERLKGLLPRWVPVSERLPKDRQFVIYWIENAAFAGVGRFDPDSRMYHGSGGWVNQDDVSHWMPLPAPTEAGEVTK